VVAGHPQLARMPAPVILVYAAAVYLVFLAVLGSAYRARVPALIPRLWLRRHSPRSQRDEENDRKQAT
jgi:hypothetical protein